MNHKKVLESKVRIRFHDCDPYNHLNNSRYIDYFIATREDQLIENYGLDIYDLVRREGLGWVSAETNISYLYPAGLMEEVLIETQLLSFSEKSLQVEGIMWDKNRQHVKAVMWTKLVHYNLQKQASEKHSPDLMEFFQSVATHVNQEVSFHQRIQSLRNKS